MVIHLYCIISTTLSFDVMIMMFHNDERSQCDFVLKNFDIRQSSLDQEIEALRQASAILSGA